MKFLFIIGFVLVSLTLSAQSRDTLVTKKLYYLENESNRAILDTQKVWSNKLTDYIDYSRIDLGNRMNMSLRYQKRARNQFYLGMGGIALGAFGYTMAGHSDPIVYIEATSHYTRDYFNKARNKRDAWLITGSLFTAAGAYFVWRSYENNRKSRWCISPNGIQFNF